MVALTTLLFSIIALSIIMTIKEYHGKLTTKKNARLQSFYGKITTKRKALVRKIK